MTKHTIIQGDCREVLKKLQDNSIHLVVTSPPYNVGLEYDFYDALIWIGIFCKGTETNTTRYLHEFVTDIVEHNVSRFNNTPMKKEVFDMLQKVNEI